MEGVEKRRRTQRIITITIVVVIIAVIVTAVALVPRPMSVVQLPPYLDRCVNSAASYHAHPSLKININGTSLTIPALLGIQGGCNRPLHTHDTTGVIHIETDDNQNYTLGDFFLIWGASVNDARFTVFNSNQLFTNHVDLTHTLTMTVNTSPNTSFQSYVLPRTAGTTSEPCSLQPNCTPIEVVITYA